MDADRLGRAGILGSLRSLCDGLLASAQDRLELLTIELREEKLRLVRTFVWICSIVFAGMMATVFASLTLVYLFWETARLELLGGLTALYAAALVATIMAFRRHLARQPSLFSATQQELAEDRACIRNRN